MFDNGKMILFVDFIFILYCVNAACSKLGTNCNKLQKVNSVNVFHHSFQTETFKGLG